MDSLVREHLGFSAHTEVDTEKRRMRRTLEAWGEDNYDNIMAEFFANLPERCVNTRLCRAREAVEWKRRGGVIICVLRPSLPPHTQWEIEKMREIGGYVDATILNEGSIGLLQARLLDRLEQLAGSRDAKAEE